jgi:uncharacterized protein YcfJ
MEKVFVADGADIHLVDSLSGSVLAAKSSAPIVLAGAELTADQTATIKSKVTATSEVASFGGTVSSTVKAAIQKAIQELEQLKKPQSAEDIGAAIGGNIADLLANKFGLGKPVETPKPLPVISASK